MKAKFWLEEQSIKDIFETLKKTKNLNATLWDLFSNYNPKYYEDSDPELKDFYFPEESLALSDTFYGFNNDAGTLNLSYEEEQEIVTQKFEVYKNEISELINQEPDPSLQPHLDYEKLDTNEELEFRYWDLIETNPFMHEFESNFCAWKNKDNVLFLSVTKDDNELPYYIHLGGLALVNFTEILDEFNSITG